MEVSLWQMIEQAKEELQILEAQYPDRFGYLKLELKSFIFVLQSQYHFLLPQDNISNTPTSSATTQVSSTSKKRKLPAMVEGSKLQRVDGELKRKDRVDLVLDRARSCLQKIRDVKSSLC